MPDLGETSTQAPCGNGWWHRAASRPLERAAPWILCHPLCFAHWLARKICRRPWSWRGAAGRPLERATSSPCSRGEKLRRLCGWQTALKSCRCAALPGQRDAKGARSGSPAAHPEDLWPVVLLVLGSHCSYFAPYIHGFANWYLQASWSRTNWLAT